MAGLDYTLLSQNIDRIAEYDFTNQKVFGSAYCVFHNGTLMQKCYGRISPDSPVPVTANTLFRLASMTKPITAVAALILCDRGLLSLDDPIDLFLPEYKNIQVINPANPSGYTSSKCPTVRNILSHTSGIGGNDAMVNNMTDQENATLDTAVSFYARTGLAFEPGTAQRYSATAAFDVLARIIEIVSETTYPDFLMKEIFTPCHMNDTTFVPTPAQRKRMSAMHTRTNGQSVLAPIDENCMFENTPCTHYLGGAGLVSTLQDYCSFANMLLREGTTENGRLLHKETFRALCTPQVSEKIMPGSTRWGLGVRIITEDTPPDEYPYLPKHAFGWSGAYGCHFWIDPAHNLFAVFMKNSKVDGGYSTSNISAQNFEKAVYAALLP